MNIKRVSIDLGNSMIKAAAFIDGNLTLKKMPNRVQINKTINQKAIKFQRNNKIIYLGVGELNNNVLKHTRHNLLEQTLTMITELYPNDNTIEVDLKLGLPPIQLFNDAYLEQFKNIFTVNSDFNFSINSIDKKVRFKNVDVFAEGYSGFIAALEHIDTKQEILTIDVGGGTTDPCNYQYDYEDGQYYPNEIDTIETGSIDLASEIANYFNTKEGADITVNQIDHILKNDLDVIEFKGNKYSLENYIHSIDSTVDNILNKITNKFGQLDRYVIIGIGGGYKTLYRIIKDKISKDIKLDDDTQFYANVIGYLEQ